VPYPSAVNALLREYVGTSKLKKGLVSVTPYPIRFSGVDWAFATPRDGIAVDTMARSGNIR
jgi:hypothetical protein